MSICIFDWPTSMSISKSMSLSTSISIYLYLSVTCHSICTTWDLHGITHPIHPSKNSIPPAFLGSKDGTRRAAFRACNEVVPLLVGFGADLVPEIPGPTGPGASRGIQAPGMAGAPRRVGGGRPAQATGRDADPAAGAERCLRLLGIGRLHGTATVAEGHPGHQPKARHAARPCHGAEVEEDLATDRVAGRDV